MHCKKIKGQKVYITKQLYSIQKMVKVGVATYTEPQLDQLTQEKGALEWIVEPPFLNVNWC